MRNPSYTLTHLIDALHNTLARRLSDIILVRPELLIEAHNKLYEARELAKVIIEGNREGFDVERLTRMAEEFLK